MNEQKSLSDREIEEFSEIVAETIDRLITYADRHDLDRDGAVQSFATVFFELSACGTFEHYGEEKDNA